jgi:hypothetical protein
MTQVTIDQLATTRTLERGPGHFYTLVEPDKRYGPFPGATAITGLQDSLGGSDGLMNWAVGLAMDQVSASLGTGIDFDEIRSLAFGAKNKARDEGSAVHEAVDRFNRNIPLELTPVTAPYVAHYASALRRENIEVLHSEKFVVNTTVGFGGTYDSLVRVFDGERGLYGPMDVKTGKAKASQRLQLTGLSMGQYHGEAGLEAEPMPALDSVGWILLLRPTGYELIRHDITDADRDHFISLVAAYHRIRAWQEDT